MNNPKRIGDITVYDDVTVDDLGKLLKDKVISVREFYDVVENGKMENDKVKIYKSKTYKK
jgi:hypothetical protein